MKYIREAFSVEVYFVIAKKEKRTEVATRNARSLLADWRSRDIFLLEKEVVICYIVNVGENAGLYFVTGILLARHISASIIWVCVSVTWELARTEALVNLVWVKRLCNDEQQKLAIAHT